MKPGAAFPGLAAIAALLQAGRRSDALAGARRHCVAEPGDPRPLALVAAGPLAAKAAHLARLRRGGFFER